MARVPPSDLTLINDNGSHEEPRRGEAGVTSSGRKAYPRRFADAFDALEFGLPLAAAAPEAGSEGSDERSAPGRASAATSPAPRAADVHVPMMAAGLIIAICVAIGGAAAVLVFHERVIHITATWTANR
ncbi:MAG TPA: hypothetical protein VFI56_29640 [Vicinamibacterales bacterium]|nr:hypothetical protein [Vicinamibacterales bacterium]